LSPLSVSREIPVCATSILANNPPDSGPQLMHAKGAARHC
jgi:hypothetical protein